MVWQLMSDDGLKIAVLEEETVLFIVNDYRTSWNVGLYMAREISMNFINFPREFSVKLWTYFQKPIVK